MLQLQLGVAGDPGRELGGQREGLVEGVGVERLGAAVGGGHRLDAGAHDVVVDVLGGQRPAGGLAVGAQHSELLAFLGANCLHELGPEEPRGAQLGDLHEEVHADAEEEREARREVVDVEPGCEAGAHVLDAVGQGVAELEIRPSPPPPACGSRRSRSS